MGFTKKWDKLDRYEFTTFRVPRKDKDWQINEIVQIFLKPRSKDRKFLGTATIVQKNQIMLPDITDTEGKLDGFAGKNEMIVWLINAHINFDFASKPINKFTLLWVDKAFNQ
jgi:hypothetical protein